MLVGNFNLPHIDWQQFSSPDKDIIFDMTLACDLTQVLKKFTAEHGSSRLMLDLILLGNAFADYSVNNEESEFDHKRVPLNRCLNRYAENLKGFFN